MLNIKKYANGKFFDLAAKEYIKPEKLEQMIKKGENLKITIAKNGKDITDVVFEQFSKKDEQKQVKRKLKIEIPFLKPNKMKTDKITKWVADTIDTKIEKLMGIIKLPTRQQVAGLEANIKELNKKIDALELSPGKALENKTETSGSQVLSHAAYNANGNNSGISAAV